MSLQSVLFRHLQSVLFREESDIELTTLREGDSQKTEELVSPTKESSVSQRIHALMCRDILIHHLFPLLSGKELGTVARVCKVWYEASQEEALWKEKLVHDYPFSGEFFADYKREYRLLTESYVALSRARVNLETLKIQAGKEGRKEITCLALKGDVLVSADSDRTINIWDLKTRACIRTLSGDHLHKIQHLLLQENKLMSVACDGVRVWDLQVEEPATLLPCIPGRMSEICCREDLLIASLFIIGSSQKSCRIQVFDLQTNQCLLTLPPCCGILKMGFIDKQAFFIRFLDRPAQVEIWNIRDKCLEKTISVQDRSDVRVNPLNKDKMLISSEKCWEIWDLTNEKCLKSLVEPASVNHSTYQVALKGQILVDTSCCREQIRIRDLSTNQTLRTFRISQDFFSNNHVWSLLLKEDVLIAGLSGKIEVRRFSRKVD